MTMCSGIGAICIQTIPKFGFVRWPSSSCFQRMLCFVTKFKTIFLLNQFMSVSVHVLMPSWFCILLFNSDFEVAWKRVSMVNSVFSIFGVVSKEMLRDLPVLKYPVSIMKLRSYMHPKKHDDQISCFLITISCVYCLYMKKLGPMTR